MTSPAWASQQRSSILTKSLKIGAIAAAMSLLAISVGGHTAGAYNTFTQRGYALQATTYPAISLRGIQVVRPDTFLSNGDTCNAPNYNAGIGGFAYLNQWLSNGAGSYAEFYTSDLCLPVLGLNRVMRWGYQIYSNNTRIVNAPQIPTYFPTPGQFHTFRLQLNFDNAGSKRWEMYIDNILVKTDYNGVLNQGSGSQYGVAHEVGVEVNFAGAQYEPQLWSSIARQDASGTWLNAAGYTVIQRDTIDGYRVLQGGGTQLVPCMNDPVANRCPPV